MYHFSLASGTERYTASKHEGSIELSFLPELG